LTRDEGTSGNTNEETKYGEFSSRLDQSGHGGEGGGANDDSHQDTGSVLVTCESKDETHEDSSCNTNNRGSPDFFFGESESVTDLREERRGAIANQMKKAMKKPHHEQWKTRMCGLVKMQSLILVALSS
jgi:hypothetical protein